jgi:hypothetical protein
MPMVSISLLPRAIRDRNAYHVCNTHGVLREPGPTSPSRVAETLANGLAADPRFCDLLANVHLHLEHEVDLDRVVEIGRTSAAAVMSLADAIEQALPALGRSAALNVLLAAYSLAGPCGSSRIRRRG